MRTAAIESPYYAEEEIDVWINLRYLDYCILDALRRGFTPYASHRMLTTALNDKIPEQRAEGIRAGIHMSERLDARLFYCDLGWGRGMEDAKKNYEAKGLDFEICALRETDWLAFREEVQEIRAEAFERAQLSNSVCEADLAAGALSSPDGLPALLDVATMAPG